MYAIVYSVYSYTVYTICFIIFVIIHIYYIDIDVNNIDYACHMTPGALKLYRRTALCVSYDYSAGCVPPVEG